MKQQPDVLCLLSFCIITPLLEIIGVLRCPVSLRGELSACLAASYCLGHASHKGETRRQLLRAAHPTTPLSPKDALELTRGSLLTSHFASLQNPPTVSFSTSSPP